MKRLKHVLIVLGCRPKRDGRPSHCMIERVRRALQLHKKNNYSAVILSGGVSVRRAPPEAVIMRVMLLNHLPGNRLVVESRSKSAVQKALFCWELIKDRNPRSVTVITSQSHLKRERLIFNKLYEHMGVSLRFECARDWRDPVERLFCWLWGVVVRAYYRGFGIR